MTRPDRQPTMCVLFVGNQGGTLVVDLNCAIASHWTACRPGDRIDFAVWRDDEAGRVRCKAPFARQVHAYETFLRVDRDDWRPHVDRLAHDYPEVNWSAVIASERSFIDASLLLGAGGNRTEDVDYVQRILVNTVRFFEGILSGARFDAVVCQTADSFFTHVLFKVARHFGVCIRAIKPAWLAEGGEAGFCLTDDEYTHAPVMIETYRHLKGRALTQGEREQAEKLRADVLGFDLSRVYAKTMGRRFLVGPLSPNLRRLPSYVLSNYRLDKELDYRRFEFLPKSRANLLRLWRRWRFRAFLAREDRTLPKRYVLMPWHFQPEQSTLVGGIQYTNQVALAESIAKSLPLGWTLVCKEHPKGRGSRPAWQYRHLESFPNVRFNDAPTKDLIEHAGAVITITGTVAVEAVAADRAVILMGQSYFDYFDLFYRPESVNDLPELLRRILVAEEYRLRADRHDLIQKFFLAYAAGFNSGFPGTANADRVAQAIMDITAPRTDGDTRAAQLVSVQADPAALVS
jgi:hypothetical protein